MAITHELLEKLQEIAKTGDERAHIMLKSEMNRLLTDRDGNVCALSALLQAVDLPGAWAGDHCHRWLRW